MAQFPILDDIEKMERQDRLCNVCIGNLCDYRH